MDVCAFTCHSKEKIQVKITAMPAMNPEVTEMRQAVQGNTGDCRGTNAIGERKRTRPRAVGLTMNPTEKILECGRLHRYLIDGVSKDKNTCKLTFKNIGWFVSKTSVCLTCA